MTVIRILVALVGAILKIAADAFAHLALLLAGLLAAVALALGVATITGSSALTILRRRRNRRR